MMGVNILVKQTPINDGSFYFASLWLGGEKMHKYILEEKTRFKELSDLLVRKGFIEKETYYAYGLVAMFVDFDNKQIDYSYSVTCAACYCSGRYRPIQAGFIIDNFDEIVEKKNYSLLDDKYYVKKN